ncbi:MAG TPA: inorganic phosphate transporter [Saprospiraceae bacterium]|nr:inorganic phosphate transporter [Saprospiraceae bacterium]
MMLGFIADLSANASVLLIVCLVAVCAFEAINGFHDTANAVATVIYTKTLPPVFAVIWSGVWNFIGAMFGGIAVAMGMIKLMPLNDMMTIPLNENIAMVLAILFTAIAWNLGTWYFGIPCSSSHTMIGALLGGGFAYYSVHGGAGPNWDKAKDVGMSLLISPLFGFALAILLMFLLRATVKKKKTIFKSPDETKKAPPTWIRAILVTTCTLVSYFHGNNDGQKGVGLLMVVLIAFMPMQFALAPNFNPAAPRESVVKIEQSLNQAIVNDSLHLGPLVKECRKMTAQLDSFNAADKASVFGMRKAIQGFNKKMESALKSETLKGEVATVAKAEVKKLKDVYEFRVTWAVILISLCLGIGTMVGWKRIVVTIGEKIGKSHLTYAQGASAELCAAATIGVSSYYGLPVSTTHVLSSGIAGTMVAEGGVSNLRKKTITNIALAWLLTLPVTFIGAAIMFFLFRMFA